MLRPLIPTPSSSSQPALQVYLFHNPRLRGLLRWLLPDRWNEVMGVQHMKIGVFDDSVLLTGANLSESYFTNRQDRYVLISQCPELANFYDEIIQGVSRNSFQVRRTKDVGTSTFLDDSHLQAHPYKGSQSAYCSHLRADLESVVERWRVREESSSSDTHFYPLLQLGAAGIRDEETVIRRLFQETEGTMDLASGYFNLTRPYAHLLLKRLRSKPPLALNVLAAAPQANGFWQGSGLSGYIPSIYVQIAKEFFHAGMRAGAFRLLEWGKPEWTFHAKGLWLSESSQDKPYASLVGSSNFGYRFTFELLLQGMRAGAFRLLEWGKPEWTFHAKGLWLSESSQDKPYASLVGSSNFGYRFTFELLLQGMRAGAFRLLEWGKPEWTFHAKGLWLSESSQDKPYASLVGSSNFGYRFTFELLLQGMRAGAFRLLEWGKPEWTFHAKGLWLSESSQDKPYASLVGSSNFGYRFTFELLLQGMRAGAFRLLEWGKPEWTFHAKGLWLSESSQDKPYASLVGSSNFGYRFTFELLLQGMRAGAFRLLEWGKPEWTFHAKGLWLSESSQDKPYASLVGSSNFGYRFTFELLLQGMRAGAFRLLEWGKPEWTFHAKGLWLSESSQDKPYASLVGSSNFGYRFTFELLLQGMRAGAFRLLEWGKPEWTFHAKGLWLSESSQDKPYASLVGSSNFGYRFTFELLLQGMRAGAFRLLEWGKPEWTFHAKGLWLSESSQDKPYASLVGSSNFGYRFTFELLLQGMRAGAFRLLEWGKPEWTFHAKGLWLSESSQDKPYASLVGSSNFGYRSVHRDLESSLLIVTDNPELQLSLHKERARLFGEHTEEVEAATFARPDHAVPFWVRLVSRFCRHFF